MESFWSDVKKFWYEQISSRLNPRQKWLTNAIGRLWVDKDEVIETCIFESLVHFWEDEGGERTTRFQFECIENPCASKARLPEDQPRYEEYRRVYFHLDKCWRWARCRKQLWEEHYAQPYHENKLKNEEELALQDTLFMTDIIHFRKYMWT